MVGVLIYLLRYRGADHWSSRRPKREKAGRLLVSLNVMYRGVFLVAKTQEKVRLITPNALSDLRDYCLISSPCLRIATNVKEARTECRGSWRTWLQRIAICYCLAASSRIVDQTSCGAYKERQEYLIKKSDLLRSWPALKGRDL